MTERIGDYELDEPLQSGNAGQSRYGFGRRGGNEYFIKEFLSPRYLADDAPGSEETKRRAREKCARFEQHHLEMMAVLRAAVGPGASLVVPVDFFRSGAKYYKVTEKVAARHDYAVHHRPARERFSTMVMVAQSLGVLHRSGLVHGDLKPENVLIEVGSGSLPRTKLIDFDDCVREGGSLPPSDEMVGDPRFYSPELLRYVMEGTGDESSAITTKSDIFALGLMFYEYETGDPPAAGGGDTYPAEAVVGGESVRPSRELDNPSLDELIQMMLAEEPGRRPTVKELQNDLTHIRDGRSGRPPWLRSQESTDVRPTSPGTVLRGTLATPRPPTTDGGESTAAAPRLKGDLATRAVSDATSGEEPGESNPMHAHPEPRLRGTLFVGGVDREPPPPVTAPPRTDDVPPVIELDAPLDTDERVEADLDESNEVPRT